MIFRKSISVILCLCLYAGISAQTNRIDSLEQRLASVELKNSEKAELMKNISNAYLYVDSAKCRMYALDAIKLAQNTGSKKVEAAAYIALANNYFFNFRDYAKSRANAEEAIKIAQNNHGLEMEEGVAEINIGNCYFNEKQYYSSHVHYKKAEKLLVKIDDKQRQTLLYSNLCLLFQIIDDRDNIVHYANKLLKLASELNNPSLELEAQMFLFVRFREDQIHEVLEYYLDLYQKSILLNSPFTEHFALNCGLTYILLDRPREALPYLHKARELYDSGTRSINIPLIYISLAEAYALLHQTDSAAYYFGKVENIDFMYDETRITSYRIRSMIESLKGDYRSALESFKLFHHLSDSVAKVGKTTEIARMRNWLELEKKDNENELLNKEKQTQQKLIHILSGALLLIVLLFALSVFLYRKTVEKNRELKKLNTVKDKLFSVVAHDLRSPMGALVSILNLTNKEKLDAETQAQLLKDITGRVDETYGLLENLLRWAKSQMQGMIPSPVQFDAQDASRTVTDAIQYIASNKGIILNNKIKEQQIYADHDMFAAVVRNLTMNAVKYSSAVGEVNLYSELSGNMLVISVKDNGTGIPQAIQDKLFNLSETQSRRGTNNESGTGLGLVLCADFVKMNGGSIWFTSKEGEGSTFSFTVPVKELRIEN